MKYFAIVLIFGVAASKKHLDYRLALNLTVEPAKNCTDVGPFCETCSSLVACMQQGDVFTKAKIGMCSPPEKCVQGVCTEDPEPFCDGIASLPFVCSTVGIFPDPFYCNKFVLCVADSQGNMKPYLNQCDEGYGYDVATDMCSIKLVNKDCTPGIYPVPLCKEAGQSAALVKKPSVYYLCQQRQVKIDAKETTVLYPMLAECPHGETYDNYACKPKK
ncbi:hypothetical protein BDFB_007923 [Asbolus verrucosus]|uniref:Chitin-binding type-2 domain-containing protein n=1 Tax=Asbolus verrucosus TaxID=1661398 RepID=A0A482W3M0_ASBVE|nr:hypothetical protein BDFB_007923 [Asbolus verrucosus]